MKRSIRLLSFLPILVHEVSSSYLRDSNKSRQNAGWTRGLRKGGSNESENDASQQSSMHRILPRETYEYYDCSSNIVAFESVVFIEFNSDLSNLTDTERQSLEQGFLATYNKLNEAYCDLSYHRSIVDVTLEWPPRRRLKQTKANEQDPFTVFADGFNASDPYPLPQNNQTIEDYQIIGVDGVLVTERPQQDYIDIARFFVNVECHDCPTNTSLFSLSDAISPSKIHGAVSSMAQGRASGLETESCACLEDKEVTSLFRAPTAAEFQTSFNETVGELHVDGVLLKLDEVEDLVEVDVVDCSSDKKQFSSNVIADLEGSVELLTPEERRALEQGFLETYNSLTFARCDRYFRQILEVKLISSQDRRVLLEEQWDDDDAYVTVNSSLPFNQTLSTNGTVVSNSTRSTPAVYRVLGECRDCSVSVSGSFDLFDDVFRRSLAHSRLLPPVSAHNGRSLGEGSDDVCLCPANAEPTDPQAPSDQEFQEEYNTKVEKLKEEGVVVHVEAVDNVSNDEDVCELELLEDTNYYIISFDNELKGPSVEKKLTEAFRNAYRYFDREVCGPLLSEVEVLETDEVALEVVFEVVSIQTYNGSIFADSAEEAIFVETFNEELSAERINSEAASLELRAQPSAVPSFAPSVSFSPTQAPTIISVNSTFPPDELPDDKDGETVPPITKPPTTEIPAATPQPTLRPTLPPAVPSPTPAPSTISRDSPPPTSDALTTLEPTVAPTASSTTAAPTVIPSTIAPTEDDPNWLIPPKAPTGAPTASPTKLPYEETITLPPATSEPSSAPTTEFDKTIGDIDDAVADIIEDVGETLEAILGTVFSFLPDIPGFLDAVENALEKILGSDVDLDEVPKLLIHISEMIDKLSKIPWLPQLTETYAQIQDTIDGLLNTLEPDGPTASPSEVRLSPRPTTPSPTIELEKIVDEVDEAISEIVEDVGETLEKIVGHVIDAVPDIPEFLDNVEEALEEILGQPLPEVPDLPDLLEHVSKKVDEIAELPFIPDLPETTEKIQETIQGILAFFRPAPSTDSPTESPTTRPTESPTESPTYPAESSPSTSSSPTAPTTLPTSSPTVAPSVTPTVEPSSQASVAPSPPPTFPPTACGQSGKGKGSKGDNCSEDKKGRDGDTTEESGSWWENALEHIWGSNQDGPVEPPTIAPTLSPTDPPTAPPTMEPTMQPTFTQSPEPTTAKTETPTAAPTLWPSQVPTVETTSQATAQVTTEPPTEPPTQEETREPTLSPTQLPTVEPTELTEPPTNTQTETEEPSNLPTNETTFEETEEPTSPPTNAPSFEETEEPSSSPTNAPTFEETEEPTSPPTNAPTFEETEEPTSPPTNAPTFEETEEPTSPPTNEPTFEETVEPTSPPSNDPSMPPTFEETEESP